MMGFTLPSKVRWFTAYVHDPVEMYYRLGAYLHYRYTEAPQANLRLALVKRKKWPEEFARRIPRAALVGILVAFKLNRIFSKWGFVLGIQQSAKASFNSLRIL